MGAGPAGALVGLDRSRGSVASLSGRPKQVGEKSMGIHKRPGLAARAAAVFAAFLVLVGPAGLTSVASAAGIFEQMTGTWRGDGSVKWYDGTSESMRCTAENDVTNDGNKIEQTLTCANPSAGAPWRIKSSLSYNEAAGVITGDWSENNYGLNGRVTGSANTRNIEAQVSVTNTQNIRSVRVSVATNGNQQTVTMRITTPEGLTEVSVRMRRA